MKKNAESLTQKKEIKSGRLHPNNRHHGRYDFALLCRKTPELKAFLQASPHGDQTIDFSNAKAVMCLNKALLAQFYNIQFWDIPEGYLCPPIPGRADYIHYLADLVKDLSGQKVRMLDIGTGANLIYPIIGSQVYGWSFVASDIDENAVKSASLIAKANTNLRKKVSVIRQMDQKSFFKGVINESDYFEATMCNPPFHSSAKEAQAGSERKWRNLKGKGLKQHGLNFGGKNNELWCEGGERAFVKAMIQESVLFQNQVGWFTSLISKEENLKPLKRVLSQVGATTMHVVNITQGQKISRVLAWKFEK